MPLATVKSTSAHANLLSGKVEAFDLQMPQLASKSWGASTQGSCKTQAALVFWQEEPKSDSV